LPILNTEANFVNLQYGDHEEELSLLRKNSDIHIHDWEDVNPLEDLDEFAAQISALDLVISIDNSTVHMAGSLGVETLVLLPFIPDWRWMLERNDSPWYQSLQLFRQSAPGEWDKVIADVRVALLNKLQQF
jgi:ADP-heptose:LPS heptosyltransferase